MMKPKKRKGSKLVILSPALRILKLHKRCISVRKQCLNKESSRSKGPLVPCRAIQQRSIKQLKGPLVPCGTIQQMSIELNDEQLKEALLSARFALHKYSATADDVFTDVRFSRLVSASAVFDEKEKCYTYLMTIEGVFFGICLSDRCYLEPRAEIVNHYLFMSRPVRADLEDAQLGYFSGHPRKVNLDSVS